MSLPFCCIWSSLEYDFPNKNGNQDFCYLFDLLQKACFEDASFFINGLELSISNVSVHETYGNYGHEVKSMNITGNLSWVDKS